VGNVFYTKREIDVLTGHSDYALRTTPQKFFKCSTKSEYICMVGKDCGNEL
jgi:hypothetical protein